MSVVCYCSGVCRQNGVCPNTRTYPTSPPIAPHPYYPSPWEDYPTAPPPKVTPVEPADTLPITFIDEDRIREIIREELEREREEHTS